MRPESCFGGHIYSWQGLCVDGYDGILCANCVNGYYRSDNFECTECPPMIQNLFVGTVFLLIIIATIVLLVRATINSTALKRPLYSVYLKIFLNHY